MCVSHKCVKLTSDFSKPLVHLPLQILVLLDVNPEESMLDEGLAREVINRIQKLRKKVTFT